VTVSPSSSSEDTSTPSKGQWIRYALSAGIVIVLVLFARTIDWGAAWDSMRHASPHLLALAVVANFSTLVFRGARWWVFLRKAGSPSLRLAMKATALSAGLNNVLVANGGEAARVVFVTRATGIPSAKVLATVALDRLFDPIGFIGLLVLGFAAFRLPAEVEAVRIPVIALAIAIIIGLVWVSRATAKQSTDPKSNILAETVAPLHSTSGSWLTRCRSWFSELGSSMKELIAGPQMIPVILLTFLAWFGQLATFALAAEAAHVTLPLAASLIALLLVNLSLVVRPTPGNVGLFQVAYILATAEFGIAKEHAIAISLLIQTLQVIPVTILGIAMAPEFIFKRSKGMRIA
jgi:uncharacterized protein (TIRG00374 family)